MLASPTPIAAKCAALGGEDDIRERISSSAWDIGMGGKLVASLGNR